MGGGGGGAGGQFWGLDLQCGAPGFALGLIDLGYIKNKYVCVHIYIYIYIEAQRAFQALLKPP